MPILHNAYAVAYAVAYAFLCKKTGLKHPLLPLFQGFEAVFGVFDTPIAHKKGR